MRKNRDYCPFHGCRINSAQHNNSEIFFVTNTPSRKRPIDWRKKFGDRAKPEVKVLHTDFAGIKNGALMLIATPGIIANYVSKIPAGKTRTIHAMRNELAAQHGANATCPVTTAIFLRVAAEVAWDDINAGTPMDKVIPFWRIIEPTSTIAKKLRCESNWIQMQRELEKLGDTNSI